MTTQTPTPKPITPEATPGPYYPYVTGTDQRGNVTTIQPGGLIEFATEATAQSIIDILSAELPECGPFMLLDTNATFVGMAWSQPLYSIVANNGMQFNAGLLYHGLCQGGYNRANTLRQVRQAVVGY